MTFYLYLLRDEEEAGETREGDNQSPPTYTTTEIDPPAYTDALHDVLVSQRTSTSTQETEQDAENKEPVEVPLDEVRACTNV